MILKSGKWFGWLAGLALVPVVEGQEIIRDPEDATVCVGESAVFTSESDGGFTAWLFNNTLRQDLPDKYSDNIEEGHTNTPNSTRIDTLILTYNQAFDGLKVVLGVANGESSKGSNPAYLFYETNPQFPVTGLAFTTNDTVAQFNWDEPDTNQTTHYIFGVYDGNNNQITNQTTVTTHASFDLPPRVNGTCQSLEFRVSGVKVQYPECPDIEQSRYSAYLHIKPNIAPVTAEFDNNQTVLVSWTPAGSDSYWVNFAGVGFDAGDPPFSYTFARCGRYNLKVDVSPAQCANDPAFTHSATVSFTIPCPTTPTEATETEIPDQPSGAQASYPSLLLAVAAVIPLLKWQH